MLFQVGRGLRRHGGGRRAAGGRALAGRASEDAGGAKEHPPTVPSAPASARLALLRHTLHRSPPFCHRHLITPRFGSAPTPHPGVHRRRQDPVAAGAARAAPDWRPLSFHSGSQMWEEVRDPCGGPRSDAALQFLLGPARSTRLEPLSLQATPIGSIGPARVHPCARPQGAAPPCAAGGNASRAARALPRGRPASHALPRPLDAPFIAAGAWRAPAPAAPRPCGLPPPQRRPAPTTFRGPEPPPPNTRRPPTPAAPPRRPNGSRQPGGALAAVVPLMTDYAHALTSAVSRYITRSLLPPTLMLNAPAKHPARPLRVRAACAARAPHGAPPASAGPAPAGCICTPCRLLTPHAPLPRCTGPSEDARPPSPRAPGGGAPMPQARPTSGPGAPAPAPPIES
jgi:hypothetical protein